MELALALLKIEIFLPSFSIETKSWQKSKSWQTINPFHIQITLTMSWKNSSQKVHPKKTTPKKFLQKKSSKNIPPKNPQKFPPKIQNISKQFVKKIIRFWKYTIPYIALRGQKPFRACLLQTFISNMLAN